MKIRPNITFEIWEKKYYKLYKPEYTWWSRYYRGDLMVMCYQKGMSPEEAIQFWIKYFSFEYEDYVGE